MSFVLWVEAILLLAAAVLAGLGAAWIPPTVTVKATSLPELIVRIVLAGFAVAFFGGFSACLVLWLQRRGLSELLRQPGPRGLIFITPHTVSQLAAGLLAQEFAETPFRIYLQPQKDSLSLRVFLRLPEEASIPDLAERLQELLTTELSRRTGLKIQEVQVVVHGTVRAPR
ncbi:MAG: Asp23/Gls24 family envelope stress response protein [Candidatus Bipolaricaulota bacterium]|nr:Asp23/Gls24 family envelope stress response protein [Candidatus Bipolaricaulota bacterium]MDW8126960.1 hypothetical protein [Candidatus Bipolaricaulota bacterium]